ncbi:uncharacterized protein LOC134764968 [Penaeus indicus]|uniref:uncharacterized protein LOC134764968 n=1 Tax=Penaeus indicus TaxID=29960 RepID=UPI00300C4609
MPSVATLDRTGSPDIQAHPDKGSIQLPRNASCRYERKSIVAVAMQVHSHSSCLAFYLDFSKDRKLHLAKIRHASDYFAADFSSSHEFTVCCTAQYEVNLCEVYNDCGPMKNFQYTLDDCRLPTAAPSTSAFRATGATSQVPSETASYWALLLQFHSVILGILCIPARIEPQAHPCLEVTLPPTPRLRYLKAMMTLVRQSQSPHVDWSGQVPYLRLRRSLLPYWADRELPHPASNQTLSFSGFPLDPFITIMTSSSRLNPQPPPGMPFHRRASTRIRSSFRESRQAVHRVSMRLSQRRRRPRPGPATDTGTSADRPEVTHITGPPPFVNGPQSLRTRPPQPPFNPQSEPPPPYSAEPLGAKVLAEPSANGNRAGPSRDLAYKNPTDERKTYPPISPSNDLTPRSDIRWYAPSGGSQQASKKEQIRNPAFNPKYDPARPATFSQPQLQVANLNHHFRPLDSRGPPPQNLPHYGGRHPPEPLHHRGPLHQGYGYTSGPPSQAPREPRPQTPRGPRPQAPRRPLPLSQRGPVAHTLRGPQPLYLRGQTHNPNYPIRPPPQGPRYVNSPRTPVPSSRTRAPMPPGFGGNSHVYLNSDANIDETII